MAHAPHKKEPTIKDWLLGTSEITFQQWLCGYEKVHSVEPAYIEIVYVERGERKKATLRVVKEEAQEITEKILDARQMALDNSQVEETIIGLAPSSAVSAPGTMDLGSPPSV